MSEFVGEEAKILLILLKSAITMSLVSAWCFVFPAYSADNPYKQEFDVTKYVDQAFQQEASRKKCNYLMLQKLSDIEGEWRCRLRDAKLRRKTEQTAYGKRVIDVFTKSVAEILEALQQKIIDDSEAIQRFDYAKHEMESAIGK